MINLDKKVLFLTIGQIIGTIGILAFVPNTLIQLIFLLVFWKVTFGAMTIREYVIFWAAAVVMTISQIMTPMSHLFFFSTTDFFTLPWYEIVMWGFYTLSAYRLLGAERRFSYLSLLFWFLLASTFLFFSSTHLSLILALGVTLVIILIFAHNRLDLAYAAYFFLLTIVIETTGYLAGLWVYPDITSAPHILGIMPLWAFPFWMGTGLLMGKIIVPLSGTFTVWFSKYKSH